VAFPSRTMNPKRDAGVKIGNNLLGFRSAFLNASAMIAASALEKGPVSVEGARDNVEAPSGETTSDGARCAAGGAAVGPAVVRSGD
jgi:hypothetical protein